MRYTVLAGRVLFSTIFIIASAGHFQQQTVDFATWRGVPLAGVLVPLSGVMALMGGLSILVGFQARLGAWLLVAFLIPVTLVMHNFWGGADSTAQQIQQAMFMKNLTMLGGALLITYFGAGPLSLDAFSSAKPRIEPLAGRPESRIAIPNRQHVHAHDADAART